MIFLKMFSNTSNFFLLKTFQPEFDTLFDLFQSPNVLKNM